VKKHLRFATRSGRVLSLLALILAPHPAGAAPEAQLFSEVARDVGLDFVHVNGMSGEHYFCEPLGPGVGLLDYDNDGDLDAYLVQGAPLGTKTEPDPALRDRLYRNDLKLRRDGTPVLAFHDVTAASGIDARGYGMGVATGDYDHDGWVDVYVTNFGSNQLLRNNGNGTFTDVTRAAGADDPRWSTSASFLDYDGDGWLDLYVCDYVEYSLAGDRKCLNRSGSRDYCGPGEYKPVPDRLLRNRGDGTFEDVSLKSKVALEAAPALGAVAADFNGDGWLDIYVANDGKPNILWINAKDGTFRNEGLMSGAALNQDGRPEAGMGVGAADFDGDGDEDLFVTHLTGETNTLYVNDGTGMFEDRTIQATLSTGSLPYTGFGTGWFDFDNDGLLDLLAVNGAVYTIEALARAGDPYPLHQKNLLLENRGGGRYEDVGHRAASALTLSEVSRGAAFGDVDNDGDVDVLIGNSNGPTRLLINEVGSRKPWLGLRLVGDAEKRDMLGAMVAVQRTDGPTLWRRVRTDGSYCSASDPRILVGLGDGAQVGAVRVRWPGGHEEVWTGVAQRRWVTLRRGSGTPPEKTEPGR
jgi:hypothetical protein